MSGDSIGVLVSGGLDSVALLAQAAVRSRRVFPLYIAQGLAWEKVELYWLTRFLRALRRPRVEALHVLRLPMDDLYRGHWSTGKGPVPGARSRDEAVFLPGRNLALTVKAGVFCALRKIPRLWLGSLGHNPFPDATPRFFRAWSAAMSQGLGRRVRIEAPFRQLTKTQVIRRWRDLPLELSFSCLQPRGRLHCGRCNKCAERQKAFAAAGIADKTRYIR